MENKEDQIDQVSKNVAEEKQNKKNVPVKFLIGNRSSQEGTYRDFKGEYQTLGAGEFIETDYEVLVHSAEIVIKRVWSKI